MPQDVFYEEKSAETWSHPGGGLASTGLRKTQLSFPSQWLPAGVETILLADTARHAD